jgi:hypothetical protein
MVLVGFIAAWFFAASPIKRSSGVKDMKDGVVKFPCSLATFYELVEMRDSPSMEDVLISTLLPS